LSTDAAHASVLGVHRTTDPVPPPPDAPGPLDGLRVVELASEYAAFCGKLLADYGAEVILVEPPGGAPQRNYEPFVDDVPDPERSLWWWHYQSNKFGIVHDLDDEVGRAQFRDLVASADIVVEAEPPGRLTVLGVDHDDARARNPRLIWASVTPFGRENPRAQEPATDLTVLATGGPVWSCGYDDHSIPPVRGGGNQGYQTASLHAAIAVLVAVLHRDVTGRGQFIDVSMHAAVNVTTEFASYAWHVARETVLRQTCRHASARPTQLTIAEDIEGRFVPTGVPPRSPREFQILIDWIDDMTWREEYPETFFLEMGRDRGGVTMIESLEDAEAGAIFSAGRGALQFIASRLTSYEFFVQGQRRGLALPVVYSPEEVLEDEHYKARGFPVPVDHPDLGRPVTYAGAPFIMEASPWRFRRHAPRLGEHQAKIVDQGET
jgi:crotonobetainyl-CoA:carnitine CoA-transferase CaiB-like acyl-CoA transferase